MTDLIHRELVEIFIMMTCGFGIMMVFTAMEKMAGRISSKRAGKVIYLMSWLFAAKLFSDCLYRATYGKVTWYNLLAVAVGIILWKKIIYDIINRGNDYEKTSEKRESQRVRKPKRKRARGR